MEEKILNTCIVVGLGAIGMGYDLNTSDKEIIHTHVKAVNSHEDFELIAAVEISEKLRNTFFEKFNKPVFSTVEEALQFFYADVYIIACPTKCHFETVRAILKVHSPKVILCEKPLSYDITEAEEMVALCENKNVKLVVNYIRRSDIGAIEIKHRIHSGKIESPFKGTCYYSKGFYHNGSHFLNLLQYWLGKVVGYKVLNAGRTINAFDSEPDVLISFEKGNIVFFSTWDENFAYHDIRLISPSGIIHYQNGGELIHSFAFNKISNTKEDQLETIQTGMNSYQWYVMNNISEMINGNNSYSLCNANDALETIKLINTIINSKYVK